MRQEQVNLASGLLILKMIMIEAENILFLEIHAAAGAAL
jgi:hypothetical protein